MARKRHFVIYSQVLTDYYNEPQFWSNKHGWTSLHEATVFNGKETQEFRLPELGTTSAKPPNPYWVELPMGIMRDPNWEDDDE